MIGYKELERVLRTDLAGKKGRLKGSRNEPIHIRFSPRVHVGIHRTHGAHLGVDDYHFYLDRVYKGRTRHGGKYMPLPTSYRALVKRSINDALGRYDLAVRRAREKTASAPTPFFSYLRQTLSGLRGMYRAGVLRNVDRLLSRVAPSLTSLERKQLIWILDGMSRGALGGYLSSGLISDDPYTRIAGALAGGLLGKGFLGGVTRGAVVGGIGRLLKKRQAEDYRGPDIPVTVQKGPLVFTS